MKLMRLSQDDRSGPSEIMKVKDLMTRYPERIRPDAPLVEASQKMLALDVGMLIVSEGEEIVGTLTDRDIVIHAIALGAHPHATLVRSVMNPRVVCCFESWTVEEAIALMEEHRVRRLPVLSEEERVIGVLSLGDLAVRGGDETRVGQALARVAAPGPAAILTFDREVHKP